MNVKGSCLCGTVTFEVKGRFEHFYLCHCSRCQKDSGSAHGANLFSSTAQLKWLMGEAFVTTYNHLEEGHIKSFCSRCGSALPNVQLGGKLLVVPAGCLDDAVHLKPDGHIFCDSRAIWDEDLALLPHFKVLPTIQNEDEA